VAYERFVRSTTVRTDFREYSETAQVLGVFHPDRVSPRTVVELREGLVTGQAGFIDAMLGPLAGEFESVRTATAAGHFRGALGCFERYYSSMRRLHDLLVEFVSSLIDAIAEIHGQAIAEQTLYEAFTTCLFYEGLWKAVRAMSHEEAAAFLADHLRGHFSGPAREGAVDIVEELDRYRLILDPCGSGGAMRRFAAAAVPNAAAPCPEPSAQTWGRRGEVPGYCTHCAINELESMRRLGYPIFVTEFDKDPQKPCGWTVYKDPSLIPDYYFTRLGFLKDESKFTA
jgi:hypothetical protein